MFNFSLIKSNIQHVDDFQISNKLVNIIIIIFHVKTNDYLKIVHKIIEFIINIFILNDKCHIYVIISIGCSNIVDTIYLNNIRDNKEKINNFFISYDEINFNNNLKLDFCKVFWKIQNILENYKTKININDINLNLLLCDSIPANTIFIAKQNKNMLMQFSAYLKMYDSTFNIFTSQCVFKSTIIKELSNMGKYVGNIHYIQNEYDIITYLYNLFHSKHILLPSTTIITTILVIKIITILGIIKYLQSQNAQYKQILIYVQYLLEQCILLNIQIYKKYDYGAILINLKNYRDLHILFKKICNFDNTIHYVPIMLNERFNFIKKFLDFIVYIGGLKGVLETMNDNNGKITKEIEILFEHLKF